MTTSSKSFHTLWPDDAPPPIQWRSWPLGESAVRGLLLMAGLAVAAVAVRWYTGHAYLGLLAAVVLALSLWRFYVPVVFELNGDGVTQRLLGRRQRIPWSAIRRYEVESCGILLLPHANACPVDTLRGLYLPWSDRHDEVLACLRYYLDRPVD